MAGKEKFPTMVTPKGVAAFSWLTKKDTKFDAEGVYKVSIVLPKKDMEEGRVNYGKETMPGVDWVKLLLKMCADNGVPSKPGEKGCPVKDGDTLKDANGAPKFPGMLVLQFKSGFKPQVIDTKGKPLPSSVEVLNGDRIAVAFNPVYREVSGGHYMSMYLAKVMLVEKLVESTGADMFGAQDDGYVVPQDAVDEAVTDTDGFSYGGADTGSDF
jgi:hypothetical protein